MKDTLKKEEGRKLLSFGLLFAGFLFLCNPNVNLFDVLPDAVGYGLFLLALRRVTDIFPHFDAAYRGFHTLFIVNLIKIPAIFVMLYITGVDMEERGLITVFALSFAIVEWIFAIPAFRALFEGFTHIGEKEGVTATFTLPDGRSSDKFTLFTLVFLIIKGATSFLPETVYLFAFDDALSPTTFNPAVLYPFFAVIGVFLTLALGLYWLVSGKAYLYKLRDDDAMRALLSEKAKHFAPELHLAEQKSEFRRMFFLLLVAVFFSVDLLIGNRDLLPNFVAAIAFFLAFRLAGEDLYAKRGRTFSALYFIAAIANTLFSALFHAEFKYTDILFRDAAYVKYLPVVIAQIAETVFFILILLCVLRVLKTFVTEQTGKTLRPEDLVLRNEVHDGFFLRLRRFTVFGIVVSVMRPISAVLMAITDRHVITEGEANDFYTEGAVIYSARFSFLWIVLLVCGALFFVYTLWLFREIKAEANLIKSDE